MFTGGYVNEVEVIMATQNGDIYQIRWTTFLFWALMIIIALVAINVQLSNRSTALDAFQYKFRGGVPPQNYDNIRERAQRGSGRDSEGPGGRSFYNDR